MLKKALRRFTTPVSVLDQEALVAFCTSRPGVVAIADLKPRVEANVVGEIASLRVVPKPQGSSWLEATVTDGTGTVVAMWTGRKRIAGVKPGARLQLCGRAAPNGPGTRLMMLNPAYELL